jgi:serine/threonine protein kinase
LHICILKLLIDRHLSAAMKYDPDMLKPFKPRSERQANIARIIGNRYHIIKHLGEGGSGATVFAVYNKLLDRVEALKVLSDDLTRENDFIDRFKAEAKIGASLAHPNIVTIYEYQNVDNLYFFTMLYIDGPPLANFIKPSESLAVQRVCTIIATVCDAVDYAHQQGIIHRDLKVSNIILDRSGKPYVTDFGIARWERSLTLTQTGQILGSPHYVSPEQAAGRKIDARTDIYSLGVALYVLLTQHYPFDGDTPHLTIAQRLYQPPIPPQTHNPELPPQLAKILEKALQVRCRDRYQTAGELACDLNGFLQTETSASEGKNHTVSRGHPSIDSGRRSVVNKKWLMPCVAIVALVVAGSLLFILKPIDPAARAAMEETTSQVQVQSGFYSGKSTDETGKTTAPEVKNNQQGGLTVLDGVSSVAESATNTSPAKKQDPGTGSIAVPRTGDSNTSPGIEQRTQEPGLPIQSNKTSAAPPAADNPAKRDIPSDRSEHKNVKKDKHTGINQRNFDKALNGLVDSLTREFLRGKYEACLKIADSALAKLESLSDAHKSDYSTHRIEINRYKTMAAQKVAEQKCDQDLIQLAAEARNHFQEGDYATCLHTAKLAILKIESLDADQQQRYAELKTEVVDYQSRAAEANQIRKRQLVFLQKIEKCIAENNLEQATSLVDAMLVQTANLYPDVRDALLAYRKKIEQLR